MAHLSLSLFGPMQAVLDGRPVIGFESAKVRALLAYLALEADEPHSRDELAGLLWPNTPDQAARANLRNALGNLRQAIADQSAQPPFLSITRETVQFNVASDQSLDVNRFADLLAACQRHAHRQIETCRSCTQRLQEAVGLYRGDLLSRLFLDDSAAFEEWVLVKREELHHQMLEGLYRLASYHERKGDYEQSRRYAMRQLELDPWREEAHRQLMRALALSGQRSAALAQYETCRRVLAQELSAEPSQEMVLLQAQIKADHLRRSDQQHNLPTALTPVIGRRQELAEIDRLLETPTCRLLTLTGPGGIGKTRLALQAAAEHVGLFANGVWFVELAVLSDPALVPQAIAAALRFQVQASHSLSDLLINFLKSREVLLIMDNCEHLIAACAQLAETLLRACPTLYMVATSREPLNIPGEMSWPVPPLPTADPRQIQSPADLLNFDAAQLFVVRATAAAPSFAVADSNVVSITQICHDLDGLPLAIELAAARVDNLPIEQIAARLDDRFDLLTHGYRTALPRHQTLRATIDWSHDLLSDHERTVFHRLSVFAGSWSIEAAEALCTDQEIEASEVLDLLSQLVDKSLISLEGPSAEPRYRMLETIRQFAREKMIESGEEAPLRQQHLDYYVRLAERAERELVGPDQFAWLDRLEAEFDNIRSALDWSLITKVESGLRLAGALRWFWVNSLHLRESSDYFALLLQPLTSGVESLPIRAKALAVQSELMNWRNEIAQSQQLAEESLALCRAVGDEHAETLALLMLGEALSLQGQKDEAHQLFERCLTLNRARHDQIRVAEALRWLAVHVLNGPRRAETLEEAQAIFRAHSHWVGLALTLNELTILAIWRGDYSLARRQLNESISITQRTGALAGLSAWEMFLSGRLALREGDYVRARVELEESIHRLQETGQSGSWALSDLGHVLLRQGDWQRARQLWAQSLQYFREANTPSGIVFDVEGLASLAVQQGQPTHAARLIAWADATREATSDPRPPVEQADVDRDLADIRAQLNEATFQMEQEAGRKMTMDEAIDCSLNF
jgi:predicted ATPase/DNA-binding SARP family transcriptional activator